MKIERVADKRNHVLLIMPVAGRAEISISSAGELVVFAYAGTEIDKEQEPDAVYTSED